MKSGVRARRLSGMMQTPTQPVPIMQNISTQDSPAALVFGGSRGIGAAIAARLAQAGHAVALTYASRADSANEVVATIEAGGGRALAIEADSADPEAVARAVDTAVQRFGPLSVAVVNAGIYRANPLGTVPLEELDQMLAVNVRGVFLAIQASAAHMRDGGRIITIGSNTAIRTASPGSSVYAMTKAAVAALVSGAALDLAPRGITVNNIQPGPIQTDLTAQWTAQLIPRIPLGRMGRSSEIAGLAAFLAGADAGYITGASLTADGGFVL